MSKGFFLASMLSISILTANAQFKISQDIVGTPVNAKTDKTFIGSEYLYSTFVKGNVLQTNEKYFNNMDLNYDVMSDRPVFLKNGEEMAFSDPIKEFQLLKPQSSSVYVQVFKNGFPPFEKFTEKSYYMVLNSGKAIALKKPIKSIVESTQYGSATVQKNILNGEQYFIFKNGLMFKTKKDKKELLKVLDDKKEALNKFIADYKLSFKSDEDVQKLLDYYNSITNL